MPYLFPHEDVFVVLISLIIAGALFVRWFRVQDRKNKTQRLKETKGEDSKTFVL